MLLTSRAVIARLYYHATWNESLSSIRESGLDPSFAGRNFRCETGVYLAGSLEGARMMLLDCKARSITPASDFWAPLKDMSVIVVDAKRLDPALLTRTLSPFRLREAGDI